MHVDELDDEDEDEQNALEGLLDRGERALLKNREVHFAADHAALKITNLVFFLWGFVGFVCYMSEWSKEGDCFPYSRALTDLYVVFFLIVFPYGLIRTVHVVASTLCGFEWVSDQLADVFQRWDATLFGGVPILVTLLDYFSARHAGANGQLTHELHWLAYREEQLERRERQLQRMMLDLGREKGDVRDRTARVGRG